MWWLNISYVALHIISSQLILTELVKQKLVTYNPGGLKVDVGH